MQETPHRETAPLRHRETEGRGDPWLTKQRRMDCRAALAMTRMDCRASLAMTAPFHHLAAMALAFVIQQLLPNLA